MAKKAGKKYEELGFDPYEDAEDGFEDALDVSEMYRSAWGDDYQETEERFSARRKIERRRDMRRLYSQLDEFEEFGGHVDW
jgi:hypothetical protein